MTCIPGARKWYSLASIPGTIHTWELILEGKIEKEKGGGRDYSGYSFYFYSYSYCYFHFHRDRQGNCLQILTRGQH